ncbi:hypothetical protein QE152_g1775 [Popillia japonica]|uniref:Uncharacterized protein n=1 Tax=Popillia japonica TaxID=7064 RepID=A0AAW1N1C8_POPJA
MFPKTVSAKYSDDYVSEDGKRKMNEQPWGDIFNRSKKVPRTSDKSKSSRIKDDAQDEVKEMMKEMLQESKKKAKQTEERKMMMKMK